MDCGFGALAEWLEGVSAAELTNLGAFFAALLGICLTLFQLLLLRRQLKLDALIKIMDSNRQIVALGFEHPIVWAAMEGGAGTVFAEEALAQRRYLQLWMNHMQIMWGAWRLGLVSRREWEAYRLDMREFLRSPCLQEHWAKVWRYYPRGFRRLVAELAQVEEHDASPPED